MELKTGLVIAHLVGLALGVGGATLMDLIMIRFLVRGKITKEHADLIHFSSYLVTAGLMMLWVSGLSFLAYYSFYAPDGLANPKVYAKMTIVAVLTLNGMLIHKFVLPLVDKNVGQRLFDGVSTQQKMWMLSAGAVSATSWYVPLALGALREFNFVVPASHILMGYGALLLAAVLGAQIVGMVLTLLDKRQRPVRQPILVRVRTTRVEPAFRMHNGHDAPRQRFGDFR